MSLFHCKSCQVEMVASNKESHIWKSSSSQKLKIFVKFCRLQLEAEKGENFLKPNTKNYFGRQFLLYSYYYSRLLNKIWRQKTLSHFPINFNWLFIGVVFRIIKKRLSGPKVLFTWKKIRLPLFKRKRRKKPTGQSRCLISSWNVKPAKTFFLLIHHQLFSKNFKRIFDFVQRIFLSKTQSFFSEDFLLSTPPWNFFPFFFLIVLTDRKTDLWTSVVSRSVGTMKKKKNQKEIKNFLKTLLTVR